MKCYKPQKVISLLGDKLITSEKLKEAEPIFLINTGIFAYRNAQDLIDEALLCVGNECYARAFFLAFNAFEELGKGWYLCRLGHQVFSGTPKDKLSQEYDEGAKLFKKHSEKIYFASIIHYFMETVEKLELKANLLKKSYDDLRKEEIPDLVKEIEHFNKNLNKMMRIQLETPSSDSQTEIIGRNQALYVDIVEMNDELRLTTPEDFPRHNALFMLAPVTKTVDLMESYF
ncbi:MAG: AbiV family abortive infection protein [Candidatus Hodarchaeota archaeon]